MFVHHHGYRPKFIKKKLCGRYSSKLFIGFEAEMGCVVEERDDYLDNINKDFDNLLYAKEDLSVSTISNSIRSMELNSHPFNWNWMMKNHKILDKIEAMKYINQNFLKKARVNRTCGFHIHLSKEYFTKNHSVKMAKFFYTNPNFIKKISLRGNTKSFNLYSSVDFGRNELDNLIKYRIYPNYSRQLALNFLNRKTIEIRIFQGTLYKETILSYLEFALAVTMFTKKFSWENMTEEMFVSYVYKNNIKYQHLIKLIKGKLKWK